MLFVPITIVSLSDILDFVVGSFGPPSGAEVVSDM